MVKKIFFLFLLIFFGINTNAQHVSNLLFKQDKANIIVSYELETITNCNVSLFVSIDGGTTWKGPLKKVTGHVGDNVSKGLKSITWDVLGEFEELSGDNIKFQIKAEANQKTEENLVKSITNLNNAIKKNPKNPNLYKERGDLKYELFKVPQSAVEAPKTKIPTYSSTLNDYNKAILLNPKFAEAYKARADFRFDNEEVIDSIQHEIRIISDYSKAIVLKPNYTEAIYERAKKYHYFNQHTKAIDDYNQIIKIDSLYPGVFFNRAICKLSIENEKGAESDIEKQISLNKEDSKVIYFMFAKILRILKNYKSAIHYYTKGIQISGNIEEDSYYNDGFYVKGDEFFYRGASKYNIGDFNGATLDFYNYSEGSENVKEKARSNAKIAYFYRENNLLKKSLEYYNYAVELDNEYYLSRGLLKHQLQDFSGAIEDYSVYIDNFPKIDYAFSYRAEAYEFLKNYTKAIRDYTIAIEINPNNSYYYFSRAICKSELENWRGAIEDYSKCINKNPKNENAYLGRANASFNLGDFKNSIQDYNHLILIKKDWYRYAYMRRGEIKILLNDKVGGCKDLNKAAELGEGEANELIKKNCN